MNDLFKQRVAVIDWSIYETAYGSAVRVPAQLLRLASTDQSEAMAASHDLWCGLCHQHAYVSSAAVPALPFILEILDSADEQLTIEILDILLGFAVCTGSQAGRDSPSWMAQLREEVRRETARFQLLSTHPNEEIADFAGAIIEKLSDEMGG